MSDTPRKPDEPAPAQPRSDDEYTLAPDESPRQPDRPLKTIGSLTEGIDVDAASDEKAVLRSATSDTHSRYDHSTGKRKPRVLTDPDTGANALRSDDGPIVALGKLGWKAPLLVGATLFIVAVVLAATNATPGGLWRAVGYQFLHIPINTALGFAALIALKVLTERPLGYWKGALARLFVAVCAFHAVMALTLDFALAGAVLWLSGALIYGAIVWFSTRTSVKEAFVLSLSHLILWAFVQLLFWVAPMVHLPARDPDATPAPERAQPAPHIDSASPPAF